MKHRDGTTGIVALVGWVGVSLAAGAVGAVASVSAQDFYALLTKPWWAPPPWLFGPVWTLLYLLMGIAAWLVWRRGPADTVRRALSLFLAQLILNGLWTWIFFAWRLGGPALAEIVLLWTAILMTILFFWRVRPAAATLLLPYLAWVSFATALNAALWLANPTLL